MGLKRFMARVFCGKAYEKLQYQFVDLQDENDNMKLQLAGCQIELELTDDENKKLRAENADYDAALAQATNRFTPLESHLLENYKTEPMIAYEAKRIVKLPGSNESVKWNAYLSEYITPENLVVEKLRRSIPQPNPLNRDWSWAMNVANYLASRSKWVSDMDNSGVPDHYLFPVEFLQSKKGDCEDHSFAYASLHEDAGITYGKAPYGWHAWNAVLVDGKLFYVDTVTNRGQVFKAETDGYEAHFIFT